MSGDIKVMMLVGNKEDLVAERAVSTEEGQKLAADLGIEHFIETSCKESVNVDEAFDLLIGSVVQKIAAKEGPAQAPTTNTVSISDDAVPEKKKKGCVLW
jgi:GTPase SAR1 family protein